VIAVIDDDEAVRNAVRVVLEAASFTTRSFGSAEQFLESGAVLQTACVVTDIQMTGLSGFELKAKLAEDAPLVPFIFITAFGDERTRSEATAAGAIAFLKKPFTDSALIEAVQKALKRT
jgi:FixJ family two-component response regulator